MKLGSPRVRLRYLQLPNQSSSLVFAQTFARIRSTAGPGCGSGGGFAELRDLTGLSMARILRQARNAVGRRSNSSAECPRPNEPNDCAAQVSGHLRVEGR